jgi:hypothetical protein
METMQWFVPFKSIKERYKASILIPISISLSRLAVRVLLWLLQRRRAPHDATGRFFVVC